MVPFENAAQDTRLNQALGLSAQRDHSSRSRVTPSITGKRAYRPEPVEASACFKQGGGKQESRYGGEPYQPHPGTQCHRCGCSLPGLTGFTADRCEGTGRAHHNETRLAASGAIVPAYQQLTTTDCFHAYGRPIASSSMKRQQPDYQWTEPASGMRIASKASSQRPTSVRGWTGSSAIERLS